MRSKNYWLKIFIVAEINIINKYFMVDIVVMIKLITILIIKYFVNK